MVYGKSKIGKLFQRYMRVEPGAALEKSSRSTTPGCSGRWSTSSSRSCNCERGMVGEYWDEVVDAPADVPEGCMAVYVGPERRRFVIHTELLYKRAFRELLRKTEEEYGFDTVGGLRIACEAAFFERLLEAED